MSEKAEIKRPRTAMKSSLWRVLAKNKYLKK
jgi:hypothetical protein